MTTTATIDKDKATFADRADTVAEFFWYAGQPTAETIAALNHRLMNLPEPSRDYQLKTYLMAFIHPIQTQDEWKAMHAEIEKRREKWLADHVEIVEVDEGDFLSRTLDGFRLGMLQPVITMTPAQIEAMNREAIGPQRQWDGTRTLE